MSCIPSKTLAQLNPYTKPMTAPRAAVTGFVVAISAITALAGVLAILKMSGVPVGPLNSIVNSLNLNVLNFSSACVITAAGSLVFLSSTAWFVKKFFESDEKGGEPPEITPDQEGIPSGRAQTATEDEDSDINDLQRASTIDRTPLQEAAPQADDRDGASFTNALNPYQAFIQNWSQKLTPVTTEIPTSYSALEDLREIQFREREDDLAPPLARQLALHAELFLNLMKEQMRELVLRAEHPLHIMFAIQEMQARLTRYNESRAEKGGESLPEPECLRETEQDARSWAALKNLVDKPFLTDEDRLDEMPEPHFLADRFVDLSRQIAKKPWVKGYPEVLTANLALWLNITLQRAPSLEETLRSELIQLFSQEQVEPEDVQDIAAFIEELPVDSLKDLCALSTFCSMSNELTTPLSLTRFIKVLGELSDNLPEANSQTWVDFPRLKLKIIENIHANQMPNYQFRPTEREEDAIHLETIRAYLTTIAEKLSIDEIPIQIENDTSDDEVLAAALAVEDREDQLAADAALARQLFGD